MYIIHVFNRSLAFIERINATPPQRNICMQLPIPLKILNTSRLILFKSALLYSFKIIHCCFWAVMYENSIHVFTST